MKTHGYSHRKSLVVCASLFMLFTLVLAACGGPSTTGKSGSQAAGATPTSTNIPTNLYVVAQSLNPTLADHGFLYLIVMITEQEGTVYQSFMTKY